MKLNSDLLKEQMIEFVQAQRWKLALMPPLDRLKEFLTIPMLEKAAPLTKRVVEAKKRNRKHEAKHTRRVLDKLFVRRDLLAEMMLAQIQANVLYAAIQPYPPKVFRKSYHMDQWEDRYHPSLNEL
jgi:hypothetical protein